MSDALIPHFKTLPLLFNGFCYMLLCASVVLLSILHQIILNCTSYFSYYLAFQCLEKPTLYLFILSDWFCPVFHDFQIGFSMPGTCTFLPLLFCSSPLFQDILPLDAEIPPRGGISAAFHYILHLSYPLYPSPILSTFLKRKLLPWGQLSASLGPPCLAWGTVTDAILTVHYKHKCTTEQCPFSHHM